MKPLLSVVLGSLNRRKLLEATIRCIRGNGFHGEIEIIVVDGGSTDGSCDWLGKQRDILTLVQPNYFKKSTDGELRRKHTWGEFMNLGFRQAQAPWILMVSDDLLLCPGAIENGLKQMKELQQQGRKLGGGALFWREYPRDREYHIKLLPGGFVHINHGFFWKEALAAVGYAEEVDFEFYGADGDLTIRLNLAGWQTVALESAYAEHLNHRVGWKRLWTQKSTLGLDKDMIAFNRKYQYLGSSRPKMLMKWVDRSRVACSFWWIDPWACVQGLLRRLLKR